MDGHDILTELLSLIEITEFLQREGMTMTYYFPDILERLYAP